MPFVCFLQYILYKNLSNVDACLDLMCFKICQPIRMISNVKCTSVCVYFSVLKYRHKLKSFGDAPASNRHSSPTPPGSFPRTEGRMAVFLSLSSCFWWYPRTRLISAPWARPQDEWCLNQAGAREKMNSSTWTRAGGTAFPKTGTIKVSWIMGHKFSSLSKERWVTNVLSWKTWSKAFWVSRNLQPNGSI